MTHEELRKLRLKLDLTQTEMADKLLMSRIMYGLNERGEKPISKRTAAMALMLDMESNTVASASLADSPSAKI